MTHILVGHAGDTNSRRFRRSFRLSTYIHVGNAGAIAETRRHEAFILVFLRDLRVFVVICF